MEVWALDDEIARLRAEVERLREQGAMAVALLAEAERLRAEVRRLNGLVNWDDPEPRELQDLVRRAAQQIEWLLPFLDVKARESGDVAGLQANAANMVKEIRGVLTMYEAEARVAAAALATAKHRESK